MLHKVHGRQTDLVLIAMHRVVGQDCVTTVRYQVLYTLLALPSPWQLKPAMNTCAVEQ